MNSISEQREVLTHVTHVNGWNPDIYISRVVKTSVCFIVVLYATKSSYIVKVTVMTSPMDHPMSLKSEKPLRSFLRKLHGNHTGDLSVDFQ